VRDTQGDAYQDIKDKLPERRRKVFEVIARSKGVASFEIAMILNWPINCVSGRVTELADAGIIEDKSGRVSNPRSSKANILWEVAENARQGNFGFVDEYTGTVSDASRRLRQRLKNVAPMNAVSIHAWEAELLLKTIDRMRRKIKRLEG